MRKLAPGLWVERPGQDLNLRGVTQLFSRPPPYRARRPGQSFILRTRPRISVSDPATKEGTLKTGAALGPHRAGRRRARSAPNGGRRGLGVGCDRRGSLEGPAAAAG